MLLFRGILILLTAFSMQLMAGIHESNQKIFSEVIEARLENAENLSSLFWEIDEIGKEALEKGVDLSCYTYRIDPSTQELFYRSYPLWEGKNRVDVTFLLFVWPSEQEALKKGRDHEGYKTVIHSHPVPCAYTVMQNEITERRYTCNDDRCVEFCEKETFYPGDKAVDLNKEPFIHELLFEGSNKKPSITLHVYGASTEEELRLIYKEKESNLTVPRSGCSVSK